MKMYFIVIIASMIIGGCQDTPEQPPISTEEKIFMDSLNKVWGVKTSRSIDAMLLGDFYKEGNRGTYALDIYTECNRLTQLNTNTDSASSLAKKAAIPLFNILKHDSKYKDFFICFTCSTSLEQSSKYKDMIYRFDIDSIASATIDN